MEFRTKVQIPKFGFEIAPFERILFVGSCFADSIGQRFREEMFRVVVNPFGVMYNPVSILHTVQRLKDEQTDNIAKDLFDTAVFTLGTNHVYIEKSTGLIVDNCQKRPQRLFEERELDIDECADALQQAVSLLQQVNPDIRIILTISPIRYAKYGFHGSQLSKATLLLAVNRLVDNQNLFYFPAYELVLDELRDYRFYQPDMLHPSGQTVDYIWERLVEVSFSSVAITFMQEWEPIKTALRHKPFHPESQEYQDFMQKILVKKQALSRKYPNFAEIDKSRSNS